MCGCHDDVRTGLEFVYPSVGYVHIYIYINPACPRGKNEEKSNVYLNTVINLKLDSISPSIYFSPLCKLNAMMIKMESERTEQQTNMFFTLSRNKRIIINLFKMHSKSVCRCRTVDIYEHTTHIRCSRQQICMTSNFVCSSFEWIQMPKIHTIF